MAGRGRPRSPGGRGDGSRYVLGVSLTPGEREAYTLAAKAAKKPLSIYVRLVVGAHITLRGPAAAQRALLG